MSPPWHPGGPRPLPQWRGGPCSWGPAATPDTAPSASGRGRPAYLGGPAVVLARGQHQHIDAQTAESPRQPLEHAVTHHAEGPGRDLRGRVLTRGHLQHSPAQQPWPVWPTLDPVGSEGPKGREVSSS